MGWEQDYKNKLVSFEEAASVVKSGDIVVMAAGPNAPVDLTNAICVRYQELRNVTIASGLVMYPFDYMKGEYKGHIKHHSFFLGPFERYFLPQGNMEVTSFHFSEAEYLAQHRLVGDVWIMDVSAPDERGYMSFGPIGTFIGDTSRKRASTVIVQVNRKQPYVYGIRAHVHVSEVDYICEKEHDLPGIPYIPMEEVHKQIAGHIVERIPNGATIQLGLGTIANAVGYLLDGKKDLGIHTEMVTNSMMTLTQKGVVNCSKKTFRPGKITCGFAIGTTELYDFINHNIMLETMPISMINDPRIVAKNDNFISINNCLMVDLTGQICSESIGHKMMSGTGGQVDFTRGAHWSKGGMPFIALPSTAKTENGKMSRICLNFPPGSIVTTLRSDAHYIVTEHGVAELLNKSVPQRIEALINIAHPDFRDQLRFDAKKAGLLY